MPVSADFGNFGTESDGSPASEYCTFCYKGGAFIKPDQTLDEMVQSSVDFMSANLGFTREDASKLSNDVIPKLKRWNPA
jgi:hypothetical protein